MKTKRRQELKTNDLAAWLTDVGRSFSQWGTYVIAVLAVVLIVVVIRGYMSNARAEARTTAFADLRKAASLRIGEMDKSAEELRTSLDTIDDLVLGSSDAEFRIEALLSKASFAMQLTQRAMSSATGATGLGDPGQYLSAARDAFDRISRDFRDRPLNYGRAIYGMFQVETLEFVIDGDPAHRERAEKHLAALRDDATFTGTPLQTVAIDRLNDLDEIFTTVKFEPRPAPAPTPAPLIPAGPMPPPGEATDTGAGDTEAAPTPAATSPPPADEPSEPESEAAPAVVDDAGAPADDLSDDQTSSAGDDAAPE